MSLELINKERLQRLQDRSLMMGRVRDFFQRRGILEVDVPALSQSASVDAHIELVEAKACNQRAFLHSSPEYGMKRLLHEGMGDIYQLSHVFRDKEVGERHQVEFMMAEWYRMGFSLEQMMEETLEFCHLFINVSDFEVLSFKEVFKRYTQKNPPEDPLKRDYCFAFDIQPHLGKQKFTVIRDFPSDEAALAKIATVHGEEVACRFEIFYNGLELANGYEELTDPVEQRRRILADNKARTILGKSDYPMDEHFLHALEEGIPPCSGVACGFDRLMMVRHQTMQIQDVIAFPWE